MGSSLVYAYSEGNGFVEIGRVVEDLCSYESCVSDYSSKPLRLELSFKVDRMLSEELGKWLGYLPKRRTTYRTIRKYCAKRNNHK